MHYRSSLFHGVVIITTIASLIIVQSCTKRDRAESTKQDRVEETKQDRLAKQDGESTANDSEVAYASGQAQNYLNRCFNDLQNSRRQPGIITPDCAKYKEHRSTLENWCKLNHRAACNILLNLKKSEANTMIICEMKGIPCN
jgi:hypothetical protein